MAIQSIDRVVNAAAEQTGTPPDLIKIAVCLGLNFPLCAIVKRLPNSNQPLKEIFVLAVGIFYLVGIFSLWDGFKILFGASFFTYFFSKYLRTKFFMPWLNFIIIITHLMRTHIAEQTSGEDYVNNIGISGSQMILVIKLTSYAWDVYDGSRPAQQMSKHQLENRIVDRPSFLRYLSWCFFFPSVLTGPSTSYMTYSNWVDLSMFQALAKRPSRAPSSHKEKSPADLSETSGAETDPGAGSTGSTSLRIPRSGHVAFFKAVEGSFWAFLYFQSFKYISFDYLHTAGYAAQPLLIRVLFLWALASSYQLKYFVAWTFSDAACIHCGLGFNGYNSEGKVRWDRVTNVRPLAIALAQNAHNYINNWNINTSGWLRYYVYLRVTPKGKKPGPFATLFTFIVSSVWHGTRTGYYLTFALIAWYQIMGKVYRKRLRPVFEGNSFKYAYDFFTWVATQSAFGFAVQPFVLLDIKPSLEVWGRVYYYVPVVLILSSLFLQGPLKKFSRTVLRQMRRDMREIE